jgi:hypothetical protein
MLRPTDLAVRLHPADDLAEGTWLAQGAGDERAPWVLGATM